MLLSKLSTHNVSANAIEWMASYLHNRQHCTRIKGTSSSSLDCPTGVPQGSVLGPLLFSIYINDLPSICPEFRIQMYADDTVIYVHAKSKQHAASLLSGAMEKIADWMTYSCLILNYSKTVSMYFSIRGSSCTPPVISIKGQKVQDVQQVKYLGVFIDSGLTFKKHITKNSTTVKFNLAHFRFIRNQMSTDAAKLFMHAMILSHFSYCSTTWSQTSLTLMQPLQSLYKQTLKVMDKKTNSHHYCNIFRKHKLLTFENFLSNVKCWFSI